MMHCFYCGDGYAVALDRRLRDSLPQAAVYDMNPCDRCAQVMDSGGMIIIGTSSSFEALERQRKTAKREWEDRSLVYKRAHPFNFVPQATRLGIIGLSAEGAQRFSDATGAKVEPGTWTFVDEEVWNRYFKEAAEEHEQSQKSTT